MCYANVRAGVMGCWWGPVGRQKRSINQNVKTGLGYRFAVVLNIYAANKQQQQQHSQPALQEVIRGRLSGARPTLSATQNQLQIDQWFNLFVLNCDCSLNLRRQTSKHRKGSIAMKYSMVWWDLSHQPSPGHIQIWVDLKVQCPCMYYSRHSIQSTGPNIPITQSRQFH